MSESFNALRVWIQRLKAPDPAMREKSIKELELLGDTDALPALAEVFATDSEPALRAMAQETGKLIYYAALRRELDAQPGASDDERRRAAEILARAQANKSRRQTR